jgi:hypothetical protein
LKEEFPFGLEAGISSSVIRLDYAVSTITTE